MTKHNQKYFARIVNWSTSKRDEHECWCRSMISSSSFSPQKNSQVTQSPHSASPFGNAFVGDKNSSRVFFCSCSSRMWLHRKNLFFCLVPPFSCCCLSSHTQDALLRYYLPFGKLLLSNSSKKTFDTHKKLLGASAARFFYALQTETIKDSANRGKDFYEELCAIKIDTAQSERRKGRSGQVVFGLKRLRSMKSSWGQHRGRCRSKPRFLSVVGRETIEIDSRSRPSITIFFP